MNLQLLFITILSVVPYFSVKLPLYLIENFFTENSQSPVSYRRLFSENLVFKHFIPIIGFKIKVSLTEEIRLSLLSQPPFFGLFIKTLFLYVIRAQCKFLIF